MKLRFQFVLGTGLSSQAIAWFSAGHFSHVDYVFDDGSCLGARSDFVGGVPPGVQIRPKHYDFWKERVLMHLNCLPSQKMEYEAFLRRQLGKPYDKTAIWGFATGRDWRAPDSWFCSELQAAALETAGLVPRLYAPRNKITPSALALVLSAVGANK